MAVIFIGERSEADLVRQHDFMPEGPPRVPGHI